MFTGKYKNQDILLVRFNTKLDQESLKSTEVLRDIDMIGHISKERVGHFVQLLGFTCEGPRDFGLIFKIGLGSGLNKILKNVKLSTDLKYSLVRDLVVAIGVIHNNINLHCHGDLRTNRCVVDERFVLRLLITRLPSMKTLEKKLKHTTEERYADQLWTAPELLLKKIEEPTQSSDIYSFAIIVHEIIFQKGPFYVKEIQGLKHQKATPSSKLPTEFSYNVASTSSATEDASCAEMIILKVKKDGMRPSMPFVKKDAKLRFIYELIVRCWSDNVQQRPTVAKILGELQDYMKESQIDAAFFTAKRLQSVSKTMVNELLHKSAEAIVERDRAIKYLSHMMPPKLSYELAIGGTHTEPEFSENVTIYFNDLVGFALVMDNKSSHTVIQYLEMLFAAYDRIFKNYDVVPLHRVQSSLLLASGVPYSQPQNALEIAQAALQIRQYVKICGDQELKLRAGIHSGPVMSGIIGKNIPQYGLFGDTVNTASRMSSTGEIGEIQVSESTRNLLAPSNKYILTGGNERSIKGKAKMKTWWLKGYVGYSGILPIDHRLDKDTVPAKETSSETSNEESFIKSARNLQAQAKMKKTASPASIKSKSPIWSLVSGGDDHGPTSPRKRFISPKKSMKSLSVSLSSKRQKNTKKKTKAVSLVPPKHQKNSTSSMKTSKKINFSSSSKSSKK